MSDRFSDENFKLAAKAYHNITAPSDLRGRILEAAAQADCEDALAAGRVYSLAEHKKNSRKRTGKIYRLAAMAACMAIMVAALPEWQPPADTEVPGPEPRLVQENSGEADAEPVPVTASEVHTPEIRSVPEGRSTEPTGNPKPTELEHQPAVYSLMPADTDADPQTVSEGSGEEHFAENSEEKRTGAVTVPVAKLLPSIAAGGVFSEMEIRLVSPEDGTCTVEITTADSKTTEITVSKNVEDGRWEITGAAEE